MSPLPPLIKVVLLMIGMALLPLVGSAHEVNYTLENAPAGNVFWYYLKLGAAHIIPYGADHILFIAAICLLNRKLKTIIWQATAFTVAHSITLALSMQGMLILPSSIVEPVISLSIVFVAIENILLSDLRPWRIGIVFLFGLIHGLGFAGVLNEVGLPPERFFLSVASFNIGVEIGQLIVIAVVFGLIILPFGKRQWYRKTLVYPLSAIIAFTALWWTIQRI